MCIQRQEEKEKNKLKQMVNEGDSGHNSGSNTAQCTSSEKEEKEKEKLKQMENEVDSGHNSGSNSAQRTSSNSIQLTDASEQKNINHKDQQDKKKLLRRQGSTSGFTITMSFTTLLLMVLLVISAVAAVVVYRMAVTAALSLVLTFSYASTVATITGKMYVTKDGP